MSQNIDLSLSKEEALVLFEFLSRLKETNDVKLFEDQAEQRVLWDIESTLESTLSEILDPNYKELVNRAREAVRDSS